MDIENNPMIELLAVTEPEFPAVLQQTIQGFADECVAAGRWGITDAYDHAKNVIESDLPEGLKTPGNLFFHLVATSNLQKVGYLWLEILVKDNLPTVFIADIEISAGFRRLGYASESFAAVEQLAKDKGISRVCLHVFKHNEAAQALYKKLGFKTTGLNMLKNL